MLETEGDRITIPFKPTMKQLELFKDKTRFKVSCWGRRSGKSTYALNLAQMVALSKAGAKIWIVLPTYGQAKEIYWMDDGMINKYVLKEMGVRKNVSDLTLVYPNGSIISFKGAEEFNKLRGSGLDLLICDEYSEWSYPQRAWETLRPALSDKNGQALFIGTPKGENYFKKLFDLGQGGDAGWKSWKVTTWESGAPWTLTEAGKQEMIDLREGKSEDWFMQEYGAEFRKYTGLVFKEFDVEKHVGEFEVEEEYVMELGMDFGWNDPTTCIFCYFDKEDTLWVFDEYSVTETNARMHAGLLLAKRYQYKNKLKHIMGDPAAKQTIKDFGLYDWHVTPAVKGKGSVKVGIDRVEDMLRTNFSTGKPRMIIHSKCTVLIDEMLKYSWKERKGDGSALKDEPVDKNNHMIDALRYVLMHHGRQEVVKPVRKVVSYGYRPNGGYGR